MTGGETALTRTFISGASIVTRDAVLEDSCLVLDGASIVDIIPAAAVRPGTGSRHVVLDAQALVVPGFVDVHVHGVCGVDVLDDSDAVARVAAALPQFGVTGFCPTSVACPPELLAPFLDGVSHAIRDRAQASARVLPAHLESNFINPDFRGAQPAECLCTLHGRTASFSGADIIEVVDARPGAVGIVTLAPELDGGLDLVRRFAGAGIDVSLGHTGATYEEANAAFDAGASRATHLFSAMRPFRHRDPGAVTAALIRQDVAVEVICDGVHAHPAAVSLALAATHGSGFLAITDGTAASGLPHGARSRLGRRLVTALDAARYDDGTLAGSVATMDRVFRMLVRQCSCDLPTAARLTATNPCRDRRLARTGILEPGFAADLVVLSPDLHVESTWIAGTRVWQRPAASA